MRLLFSMRRIRTPSAAHRESGDSGRADTGRVDSVQVDNGRADSGLAERLLADNGPGDNVTAEYCPAGDLGLGATDVLTVNGQSGAHARDGAVDNVADSRDAAYWDRRDNGGHR